MDTLPTVDFCGTRVTRLICGGNPISGYSHFSGELDREMVDYYTMPNIQALLDECWRHGVNAIQTRGDRLLMRAMLEHRQKGGRMHWIAQTASEFASIPGNVAEIARYGPIAIYNHGTHTDRCWQDGRIDEVRDIIKVIHDRGLPAGVGSHIPEVIEHAEEKGWETDFYMCCLYNLARGYKPAPAMDADPYGIDVYLPEDPPRMTAVMRATPKPCIGFKVMAAGRNCSTPEATRRALESAYAGVKAGDILDVGMLQKHRNQVAENAGLVREILAGP